jgi:gliding motility-associated-like protein
LFYIQSLKIAIYILLLLSLAVAPCYGQLVITDSITTPSICFNDGTITVSASGGAGGYTYTITGGPSYANITYPITLAALDSVFQTMPKGDYTIKVTDASGNTAFATATVGGTYTFPVFDPPPSDTVYSTCITVYDQGGRPPLQYARSSVSSNAGFGPYQSSNSFCNLCDGTYWVRVKDSCQNIYTSNKITVEVPVPTYIVNYKTAGGIDSIFVATVIAGAAPYTYHLSSGSTSLSNHTGIFAIPASCAPDNITVTDSCGRVYTTSINIHQLQVSVTGICGSGSATVKIDSSAIAPYTITGSNGSLVTHLHIITFNSLPIDSHYHFTVTDSCGNVVNVNVTCTDTTFFYNVCPFDSSMHLLHDPVPFCYPVVVTCVSCSPVQIDTIYSTPAKLFTGIQQGVPYQVRIQDQCGFNYLTADTPGFAPLIIKDSIISCRDFEVYSMPSVFTPPITYRLIYQSNIIDSVTGNTATFIHLAPGSYQVTATEALCQATTISVNLPGLGGACMVPMFDSSCTRSYAIFQTLPTTAELWSFVDATTLAVYPQKYPNPYPGAIVFDAVPVGSYNLVSDSGCSVPVTLPPFIHTVSASAIRQCTGSAVIQATCTPPISSCNTSQGVYFTLLKDNQYIASGTTGRFTVLDPGYYVVRMFFSNTSIFNFNTYDTICPLDTFRILVTGDSLPNIVSQQVEVCGHNTGDIPYTIFGGTPPYTVQILGYPTQTVTATNDTFPNVYPGVYTMIVSDNCGISRSFSVTVIDTCSGPCTTKSAFSISDTVTCTDAAVYMTNHSTAASHYKWDINGATYAYTTDTSFISLLPGTYNIILYAYIGQCADSSERSITVQYPLHTAARKDTILCSPFALVLNTHIANTIWSDGTADSVLTVTSPDLYIATISNACGSAYDTVIVAELPGITGFELTDSKNFLCEDIRDSVILIASIDSSSQPSVIFRWNTGYGDSSAYSSQIIIYQQGSYQIIADNGFCPLIRNITIDSLSCDSECIAGIAIPNIFSPNGDNKNDTFYILHICELNPFEMHIYDRWGQLVFESNDINKGWDGKYKGSPEPEEVYWLWLSMTLPDGKTFYRSGNVTLVR